MPPSEADAVQIVEPVRSSFDDCPLIEIVQFHNCLRVELKSLRTNVGYLRAQVSAMPQGTYALSKEHLDKEVQVMSQFQLLWAVFQSHSTAEDEMIWPALKDKAAREASAAGGHVDGGLVVGPLDEQEYADEHLEEKRLLQELEQLLTRLRATREDVKNRLELLSEIELQAERACLHLLAHLDREETSALPLIKEYFTPIEMESLVGRIMGKRPSELMKSILGMMIKNLPPEDVGSMMGYMRQAVKDTYFEKWLASGGFSWEELGLHNADKKMSVSHGLKRTASATGSDICPLSLEFDNFHISPSTTSTSAASSPISSINSSSPPRCIEQTASTQNNTSAHVSGDNNNVMNHSHDDVSKDVKVKGGGSNGSGGCGVCALAGRCLHKAPLSEGEFQGVVRRLAHMEGIDTAKKSALVQALRCDMYRSKKRPRSSSISVPIDEAHSKGRNGDSDLVAPKHYYVAPRDIEGLMAVDEPPPLFSKEELEPSWQANAGSEAVMGCPHYQRRVKLRAPCCGKLFCCRLCHDQAADHVLDRYLVMEMLCMLCGSLQPISGSCCHSTCASNMKANAMDGDTPEANSEVTTSSSMSDVTSSTTLARYFCGICHLFDDGKGKSIYHCPYCNVCRVGRGLGLDYWHCMKCNACISVSVSDHKCITHSLEGNCPICSASMFESTQQIKGLKCGHFMHLSCYRKYVRRTDEQALWYRCPVCLRSMEDMHEYWGQLDAVVAVQKMPEEYLTWTTKILCHDCEAMTSAPYHFLYHKCTACGSYNTRVEKVTGGDANDTEKTASSATASTDTSES